MRACSLTKRRDLEGVSRYDGEAGVAVLEEVFTNGKNEVFVVVEDGGFGDEEWRSLRKRVEAATSKAALVNDLARAQGLTASTP